MDDNELKHSAFRLAVIENIVTMVVMGGIVVGLYRYGAGPWCMIGFVCLFNLNGMGTVNADADAMRQTGDQ